MPNPEDKPAGREERIGQRKKSGDAKQTRRESAAFVNVVVGPIEYGLVNDSQWPDNFR